MFGQKLDVPFRNAADKFVGLLIKDFDHSSPFARFVCQGEIVVKRAADLEVWYETRVEDQ
jgi:hypothetical protein